MKAEPNNDLVREHSLVEINVSFKLDAKIKAKLNANLLYLLVRLIVVILTGT
jgi:hypothetical protein